MKTDIVLFKKNTGEEVTFEDLMQRIYENSSERHDAIIATADHITKKIETAADAMMLMPNLIELNKVAVRNDDQLLALAAIVQRHIGKKTKSDDSMMFSAEDRKLLMEAAKKSALPAAAMSDE